jgi:hypothetical protein
METMSLWTRVTVPETSGESNRLAPLGGHPVRAALCTAVGDFSSLKLKE